MTPVRLRLRMRHPLLADVALAALAAVIAVLTDALGPDLRDNAALVWDVALALPLVLRRRMPATAAALVAALCLAQWVTGDQANGDLVVLIMLYTLGAWEQRRWVLASAVVVAEVGVVMAVTRWVSDPHPWVSGLLLTGTVTASWVLGAYVRARRAYIASMIERAETAERDRDTQARMAVATERARMAREMHDIIAHSLSVMITLNDAAVAIAPTDTLRRTVTQASEVGRQALAEMQRTLGVLRGDGPADLAPQPGTAQLSDLVALVRSAGLSIELVVTGDPTTLGPSAELAVYRIVQESLTNVLKHATNVSHVTVELTCHDDRIAIRVQDDGDPVAASSVYTGGRGPSGHGLAGMRERAGLYGGHVQAHPAHGGGWVVVAELPFPDLAVTR